MPHLPPGLPARDQLATHEVLNQPAPEGDRDLWAGRHGALREAIAREGGQADTLASYGATLSTRRDARRRPRGQ